MGGRKVRIFATVPGGSAAVFQDNHKWYFLSKSCITEHKVSKGESKSPLLAESSIDDKIVQKDVIKMDIITKYVARRWFLGK